MTDLSSLIARVEGGEGADREIEAAVHLAMFPDDFASKIMRGEIPVESWEHRRGGLSYVSLNSGGTSGGTHPISQVTTDLNAVTALCERVLPEAFWQVGHDEDDPARFKARVLLVPNPLLFGRSPTPARALLAAMLRAKEADHG